MTISTLELAEAVLDWARTPGNHGGNPYCHRFVRLADIAKAEITVEASRAERISEIRAVKADDDARQRQRHGEAIARRKAANTPWPSDGDTRTTLSPEPFDPEMATHAKCDICGKIYDIEDLDEFHDFWSRYTIGSECPAGDCPSCGAFCYVVRPDVA